MSKRTVFGIGLETGDQFADGSYIAEITGDRYTQRFAHIKRPGRFGETRIRLDDEQTYQVPANHHAPYRRYVMGVVTHVERTGYTVYGNPIMTVEIRFNSGNYQSYRISDNSAIAYCIENPEFREHVHYFELTRANRISGRHKRY